MNEQAPEQGDRHLALYLTGEHPCAYLAQRRARTLFVDPTARIDGTTYQQLLNQGFRRSGTHVYRPSCRDCDRCIPVRIPIADFRPNRSQRRNWRHNAADLVLVDRPARFDPRHFDLYQRYLLARHPTGGMAEDADELSYRRFLTDPWGGATRCIEFRDREQGLVAVAVTDLLDLGLSAVYTFFDPTAAHRGLGTFAILAQIEAAHRLALPYLYLGYWIAESPKMAYKSNFRPLEARLGESWHRLNAEV